MLRETRARWLAAATAAVVVALAALFADWRNPDARAGFPPDGGKAGDRAGHATGRAAFERLDCTSCHALAGVGNPSAPLDGVGARRDREALRDWTLGTGAAEAELPRSIVRSKRRAADDADLEALIDYLHSSR